MNLYIKIVEGHKKYKTHKDENINRKKKKR